jgi:hypothetical protein
MIPIAKYARIPSPRPPWHSQTYGGRNVDHIHIVSPDTCSQRSGLNRVLPKRASNVRYFDPMPGSRKTCCHRITHRGDQVFVVAGRAVFIALSGLQKNARLETERRLGRSTGIETSSVISDPRPPQLAALSSRPVFDVLHAQHHTQRH